MSEALVVNASPLIFLAHIDGLDWLIRLTSGPVIVSKAVISEIEAGAGGRELVARLNADTGFSIISNLVLPSVIAAWDLGAGESQVLAHCYSENSRRAVLDDKAGRDCARSLGIPVIGTLGIVLVAKQHGWIPAARPVIEQLLAHNLYLTPDLVSAALNEVGE